VEASPTGEGLGAPSRTGEGLGDEKASMGVPGACRPRFLPGTVTLSLGRVRGTLRD
jgi:hypothetical protein